MTIGRESSERRGNVKDKVDRDLFHAYLWKKSEEKSHKLRISQIVLAEELGVTQFSMARIFSEMRASGRLRRVRGIHYVTDPDLWKWKNPAPDPVEGLRGT